MGNLLTCGKCGQKVMYLRPKGMCPLCEQKAFKKADQALKSIRI